MVDDNISAAGPASHKTASSGSETLHKDVSTNLPPLDAASRTDPIIVPERKPKAPRKGVEPVTNQALYADRIRAEQFSMAARPAVTTTFINALNGGIITYAFWSPASARALGV
jgi:hypothetical protein